MAGSWCIKHGSASGSRALCTPKPIGLKLGVGTATRTWGWPSGCQRRARSRDPASPSDGAGDKSPLCSAQTDGTAGAKPTQKRGWGEAGGLGLCLGAFTLKKGLAASSGMVQLGACGPGQPAVCLRCWLAPLISFFPPAFRSPGDGCWPPPLRLL